MTRWLDMKVIGCKSASGPCFPLFPFQNTSNTSARRLFSSGQTVPCKTKAFMNLQFLWVHTCVSDKDLIKCHRCSNRKHPQYLQIYGSYVRIQFPCGWQLYLSGGQCTILERKAHLWWHSPISKFLCTVTQVLKPREMCAWSTPRCGCYVVVCLFTLVISDPVKIEPVTYVGKKSLQTHSGKKLPFSCLCD